MKIYDVNDELIQDLCRRHPEVTYGAASMIARMMHHAHEAGRMDNEVVQKDIADRVAMSMMERDNQAIRDAGEAIRKCKQAEHWTWELARTLGMECKRP